MWVGQKSLCHLWFEKLPIYPSEVTSIKESLPVSPFFPLKRGLNVFFSLYVMSFSPLLFFTNFFSSLSLFLSLSLSFVTFLVFLLNTSQKPTTRGTETFIIVKNKTIESKIKGRVAKLWILVLEAVSMKMVFRHDQVSKFKGGGVGQLELGFFIFGFVFKMGYTPFAQKFQQNASFLKLSSDMPLL